MAVKKPKSRELLELLQPETIADLAVQRILLNKAAKVSLPSIAQLLRIPKYEEALRQRVESDLSAIVGIQVEFQSQQYFTAFLDHRACGYRFIALPTGLLRATLVPGFAEEFGGPLVYLDSEAILWAFLFKDGEELADVMAAIFQRMFFALVERPDLEGLEVTGDHDPQAHQQNWLNWSRKWASERRERITPRVNGLTWLQFYRAWFEPRKRKDKTLRERASRGRDFFASQDRVQLKTIYFPPIMAPRNPGWDTPVEFRDYDAFPLTREEIGISTDWLVRRDGWNTGVVSLIDPGERATKYFRTRRRSPFVLHSLVRFGKPVST